MSMHEEPMDPMLEQVREIYHVPNETPREEMWTAISARLNTEMGHRPGDVLDIGAARRARPLLEARGGWLAAAAAAVLVVGIGIGRMSGPTRVESVALATVAAAPRALTLATQEHLGRTESFLTMLRTDARAGRIDHSNAGWASGLLSQTRLLMDVQEGQDPTVRGLLLDLELLLIQIVEVSESGSMDEARARTELDLALRSLEQGEVLPRIQAALPPGMAGT